jgi:hypothetical protein
MANSKNPLPKRVTIFEQEKLNRLKAIEFLKQLKQQK